MLSPAWRNILYLLLLSLTCSAQKLPGRHLALVQALHDQLTPLDLTAIPDGAEIAGFLMKDKPKRYYFIVEEDGSPVTVRVTPCDAPLEWSLTLQELEDRSSGEGSGGSEPLSLQKGPREPVHGQSVELFHYQGNDVESYLIADGPAGIYRLQLVSKERDTMFHLYATTSPESDQPYPKLPGDSRLELTFVGHTRVSLVWKPIPATSRFRQPARYCVVVNKEHNYKSLCAVEAKLKEGGVFEKVRGSGSGRATSASPRLGRVVNYPSLGQPERRAPSLALDGPPFREGHIGRAPRKSVIGQSAAWSFGEDLLQNPTVSRRPTPLSDIRKTCTGTKNVCTVSRLKPGTHYYFDVFVSNPLANVSSAYVGTFVKTQAEVKQKVLELKGRRVTEILVKRGTSRSLRFRPVSSHRSVTISLQSCYQKVHLQIRQNRKVVTSRTVEGVKHFQLVGKPKARYLLRLKAGRGRPALLKIHVTTHPGKQPFPTLPGDTRLKVFDRLRACSTLTVAWLAAREMNKYCLYRKLVAGKEKPRELQNHCRDPKARSKLEKVSCQYFHGSNLQKAVMTARIEGLEPGKSYLLDVYVTGQGRHSVKYQSKIVRMRKTC